MKKTNLIVIGTIIIGLGIGTFIGLEQIKNTKITIAEESNKANETAQTSDQVLAEYYQTRTAEQREAVIEKIKAIFGEDLQITFKEAKTRYYSYGIPDPAVITDFVQLKVIEIYEDNKGFTTEVDVANNEILNRTKSCMEEMQRITNDQAKEIAKNLLAKTVENPEGYELEIENEGSQIYNSIWRKWHEGQLYDVIPSGKGQSLAKMEERTIAICLRNGELMNYDYKPALTEEELTKMAEQWGKTQRQDIEAIRKILGDSNTILTFVNYVTYGTKQREIKNGDETTIESYIESYDNKTYRVYRDENGYCYDVDEDRNITSDTEVLKGCGGWKSPEEPKELTPDQYGEIRNFEGSQEDIETVRNYLGNPEAKIIFVRNEIAEGKWFKIYREENDPCLLYGVDENGKVYPGREPIDGCRIP